MAQKTPVFIKPKYDRQNYKYNRNMWAIVCKISRWRMVSLKKKIPERNYQRKNK